MKTAFFSSVIDISFEDSIEVYNISSDSQNSDITFDIVVYHGFYVSAYKGEIKSFAAHCIDTGWTALLYNSNGADTLWQYKFKWDLDDLTWIGIHEIADGDEFYFELRESGGNYIERFNQNGDTLGVCYDTSLYDGMRGDTSGYSRDEKNIIDSLVGEFGRFYDTTLAINDNYYGELLSYLLNSENFWQMVSDRAYGGHSPEEKGYRDNKEEEKICALAALGSLKCFPILGGLANPVCVPSVGTSIACAVHVIWQWITNIWD